ncbi:VOC family protein [Chryseobacterium sp. MEBOG07]|uniref:VOC family protein n=1 Tax=Chryseobacterium sp. MEBOG07 TaxID=2879939 RepID=UPI001F36E391|nr:VOC family protein [Chryseobacterium sp. MEBOG07]UKB77375.1 VOC family protein [Chryseobacterium sp. MEBOG07]
MKPTMIWSNLAVANLERTHKFYTELGFKPNGPHTSDQLVSFFFGEKDFIIHFFLKQIIESNLKQIQFCDTEKANEIVFTLSADTKDQVDAWAQEVEKAGGKIISEPESFGDNYYGFVFADPDGHKFNVFYM